MKVNISYNDPNDMTWLNEIVLLSEYNCIFHRNSYLFAFMTFFNIVLVSDAIVNNMGKYDIPTYMAYLWILVIPLYWEVMTGPYCCPDDMNIIGRYDKLKICVNHK